MNRQNKAWAFSECVLKLANHHRQNKSWELPKFSNHQETHVKILVAREMRNLLRLRLHRENTECGNRNFESRVAWECPTCQCDVDLTLGGVLSTISMHSKSLHSAHQFHIEFPTLFFLFHEDRQGRQVWQNLALTWDFCFLNLVKCFIFYFSYFLTTWRSLTTTFS